MNRRTALKTAALAAAVPLAAVGLPAAAGVRSTLTWGPPPNLASRLRTLPARTRQVVIVHGPGYATTTATLVLYARVGTAWTRARWTMTARIGSGGFSDNHVEGVPTTPTGVYGFGPTMYGIAPNLGVRYPYHRLVENDWWNENSGSPGYNTFHHGSDPGGPSEALWTVDPGYRHFAFITYNVPAVPGKGSAIFLHQNSASGGPTAGCVSLAAADLRAVLRWLDPAAEPRIVLAPTARLSAY